MDETQRADLTTAIGKRLVRIDAEDKVRGTAVFGADIHLPGELTAKYLPSPYAHAEILSIDTSRADALPGVYAVITGADVPAEAQFDPSSRFHAFLARQYVVFAGQPVAAVAAADLATAEAALDLIKVRYRVLPAIIDIDQALAEAAPSVAHADQQVNGHAGGGHSQTAMQASKEVGSQAEIVSPNIAQQIVFKYGDLEAAFANSDIVVENTYRLSVVHQGYIEPHAVTARWDSTVHVTVWECVQGAFAARDLIAETLGIPHSNITLHATEIGGGFGGKVEGLFAPIAVLLARKAQRPVKLIVTRAEEFSASNPAPQSIIWIKTGARRDGVLTALEAVVKLDAGAFPTGWIMTAVSIGLRNAYNFPAWHITGLEVLTNKASVGSYRAPGAPNATFAIESQMDEMAIRLQIDPLSFRLDNLLNEGDLLPTLEPQARVGAREVLEALRAHAIWPSLHDQIADRRNDMKRGTGLAMAGWDGANGPAAAFAILEADGRIKIVLGTVDLTGTFTGLAQIAGEALGVSADRIIVTKASPDFAPFAPMSAGSQTIYATGAAVLEASRDLKLKLYASAAQILKVNPEALSNNNEQIYDTANPENALTYRQLYQQGTEWFATTGPIVGIGSAPQRQRAPGFAACVAQVVVDTETGVVCLENLTIAQDVGKAINPLLVEGQMQGGATQGVGLALWEEVLFDEEGHVRNPNLLDYRMPTASDMPAIRTIIVEAPGGDGPYGAKIVGEPSIIPPVTAIANAIRAAIGARLCELPLSPERVWRAIETARLSISEESSH